MTEVEAEVPPLLGHTIDVDREGAAHEARSRRVARTARPLRSGAIGAAGDRARGHDLGGRSAIAHGLETPEITCRTSAVAVCCSSASLIWAWAAVSTARGAAFAPSPRTSMRVAMLLDHLVRTRQ